MTGLRNAIEKWVGRIPNFSSKKQKGAGVVAGAGKSRQ
jgi:hypothetical protein